MNRFARTATLALGLCLLTLAQDTAAAAFPARPITLIVPYSAGGASEVAARAVADGMAKALGQPVVVENRPGAEGAIAVQAAVAAEADGHTLVVMGASMFALPLAMSPPPFDLAALAPVSTIGDVNFGLFVPASLPVRSTQELLAHARAQAEPLAYATISLAMDALSLELASAGRIQMTRVQYKGGGQAMTDLVAGRLQVFVGPVGNGLALAKEGRLRLLAVHPHRTPLAPDVPTLAEAGIAPPVTPMFMLIAAPARTPQPAVQRLAQAVASALQRPDVQERLQSLGVAPMSASPAQTAALARQAVEAYGPVVRRLLETK